MALSPTARRVRVGGPDEELFRFHTVEVRELGGFLCGRRLYETMLVGDGSVDARERARRRVCRRLVRDPEDRLQPHARQRPGQRRLAEASVAEEAAAALDATDKDVGIGGAGLAAAAIELGLVDELRMFRNPVSSVAACRSCRSPKTFRWTWSRPGRSAHG